MENMIRRVGATSAAAFLIACGGSADPDAGIPVVTVVDGVTTVVVPPFDAVTGPAWSLAAEFSTADPGGTIELHQVGDAVFLTDGALAIANSGNREIIVLDADGEERSRFGRQGEGPGEFSGISWLEAGEENGVVAYDPRQARITFFSSGGEVIETRRLAPPNLAVDLRPLALLDDGGIMAIFGDMRIFAREGIRRDTTPLFRFHADLTTADTLARLPAKEWSYSSTETSSSRRTIIFGRDLAAAGRNGRSAVGSIDSIDITLFDATGTAVMRVSGGGPAMPASEADANAYRQSQLDRYPDASEAIRTAINGMPARETYPGFERLLVDDSGRLWIGAYPRPGQATRRWIVLDSDGSVAGILDAPADATLLDSAGDRVAMLRRTEFDEEYIAVHRIGPAGE